MIFNILVFAVTFCETTKNLAFSQKWITHVSKCPNTLRGTARYNYIGPEKNVKNHQNLRLGGSIKLHSLVYLTEIKDSTRPDNLKVVQDFEIPKSHLLQSEF